MSDNDVDLSDLNVDLSDLYVDLSDLYVDLSDIMSTCQLMLLVSGWHLLDNNTFLRFSEDGS